jgi:hypothetical protein
MSEDFNEKALTGRVKVHSVIKRLETSLDRKRPEKWTAKGTAVSICPKREGSSAGIAANYLAPSFSTMIPCTRTS